MNEPRDIPTASDALPAEGIRFPLALRLAPGPGPAPAAWFIPGDSAAGWIDELAGWGVSMAGLRLYVVPASVRDRRPIWALGAPRAGGPVPKVSPRAQAYGRLAGRLYLPVDALLEPP